MLLRLARSACGAEIDLRHQLGAPSPARRRHVLPARQSDLLDLRRQRRLTFPAKRSAPTMYSPSYSPAVSAIRRIRPVGRHGVLTLSAIRVHRRRSITPVRSSLPIEWPFYLSERSPSPTAHEKRFWGHLQPLRSRPYSRRTVVAEEQKYGRPGCARPSFSSAERCARVGSVVGARITAGFPQGCSKQQAHV